MAAVASTILWVAGFGLAFVIPAGSPLIWVPDSLLLLGFIPIMLAFRPIWPWFVFGLCNTFIGIVLDVARYLPDNVQTAEMQKVRRHLAELHVPFVWVAFGVLAVLYGTGRLARTCVMWIRSRRRPASK